MSPRFQKTHRGRQEIVDKKAPLSRAARTLLLILDDSQPLTDWVRLIRGLTEDDLNAPLVQGLIHQAPDPAGEPAAGPPGIAHAAAPSRH